MSIPLTNKNDDKEKESRSHLSSQISHEEGLIDNRMTWMLTIQGFLFATLALLVKTKFTGPLVKTDNLIVGEMLNAIPILGAIISLLAFIGMYAAYESIDHHKKQSGAPINTNVPGGNVLASKLGRVVSMSILGAIASTWLYLLWKISWEGNQFVGYAFYAITFLLISVMLCKAHAVEGAMRASNINLEAKHCP